MSSHCHCTSGHSRALKAVADAALAIAAAAAAETGKPAGGDAGRGRVNPHLFSLETRRGLAIIKRTMATI